MGKPFVWSYSNLTSFELCPKKHYHEKIAKDVFQKTNDIQNYGKEAHKHFENRMVKNKPLPMDLQHHEKTLALLYNIPGKGLPEQKLALNGSFEPTGFFDSDVWCRGIVDYAKVKEGTNELLVADWKFGRMQPGFDQIELMMAMMTSYMPELTEYTGIYYWAKDKKITKTTLSVKEIPDVWSKFLPRVGHMEDSIVAGEFPAKRNFLCRKHCPVTKCPFHGE